MGVEADSVSRRTLILLCGLAGVAALGWLALRRTPAVGSGGEAGGVTIDKQAENFAQRTFDAANPPADMPAMNPGEEAVTDSNFVSGVNVSGRAHQSDATHETVTITQIHVTLQLELTIWAPADATQHVLDHEQGHREISEYYYRDADKVAERTARGYIGREEVVSGADLNAASGEWLQQMGKEISDEYNRELNPDPVQQRYDLITNYSRNGVVAEDAVKQVLNGLTGATSAPAGSSNN
jgi:hypothetical protein